MKKRMLSIVLTLCMVLMFVPQTVFAEGETSSTPSVSAYATKAQLMDGTFKPDANGTATNYGKLVFGKKSDGTTAQEWYILGKDTGVSGDNTIIFAASPIATGQTFSSDTNNKTYDSSFGVYESTPSDVNPNHYGASDLRGALQNMATNTSYFTTAEQGLMNATTVTTKDTKNKDDSDNYLTYTTTDKLYALAADDYGSSYKNIKAGSDNSTVVLARSSYWSSGDGFWLRSPHAIYDLIALLAFPGLYLGGDDVDSVYAVQPASNLDLSSVLFASAASSPSSDTKSEKITDSAAMTLRLDGTGKDIGTVTYNTTTGDIKVVKGTTSQTVALVVQGNDGTNDWYYSKKIDTSETINVSAIASATYTPASIDLSTCKIWLEITDLTENLTYAVNATEVENITSVAITGIETPVANTTLDTSESCTTTGVSSTTPQITWTPSDTTARYNTSYTASITLTAATGYEFADNVAATVSGNAATSVTKNADGTLTVTYTFPEIPDTVDPVISGIEDGKTYCSAQTVTVSDNDAIATVTVNGTEVTLDENKQFILLASGEQTIVAMDKVGNKKEMTVTVNDGHTYGAWQSNGAGTHEHYCTVEGCNGYEDGDCEGGTATCVAKAICDTCKTEYGEVDSTNHDLEKISAKASTDTETGNIEYWHCKDCGKYFSNQDGKNSIALADTVIPVNAWAKTVLRMQATASKTSIKLTWKEVPEADGYVIYWNKCGAKNAFKPIKVIKSGKTLTWTHTKLKKNSQNKYYIKAYKVIGGKRCFIKTSRVIHLATKGGKYTNVKKLKANVSSVTLKKGKTKTLKITQSYAEKNKKPALHMRPLIYTTSNKKVATVTSKGVIKATGKGSCYIYITAYSGVYTRVKVTVK